MHYPIDRSSSSSSKIHNWTRIKMAREQNKYHSQRANKYLTNKSFIVFITYIEKLEEKDEEEKLNVEYYCVFDYIIIIMYYYS